MMKKWMIAAALTLSLAACSDEKETEQQDAPVNVSEPTINKLDEVNEDVQAIIDLTEDDKFASVIYSAVATSYLLLNAPGTVDVSLAPEGDVLHINIEHTEDDTPKEIDDIAYEFYLDKPYDKIHVFENGAEIPFEVWTE